MTNTDERIVTTLQRKHCVTMSIMLTHASFMPAMMAYGKVSLSFEHIDGRLT
jgi:hypothetical protein